MRTPEPDWPPPSLTLTRVTLEILSLHGLPRPTESRPSLEGPHARCHEYAPQPISRFIVLGDTVTRAHPPKF